MAQTIAQLRNDLPAMIAEAVAAALAAQAVAQRPATARAASPTIVRESTCECGAEYKRGRDVAEIAASAVGLCGLKGYAAHKIAS